MSLLQLLQEVKERRALEKKAMSPFGAPRGFCGGRETRRQVVGGLVWPSWPPVVVSQGTRELGVDKVGTQLSGWTVEPADPGIVLGASGASGTAVGLPPL